jgi:hypothetical protein
MRQIDEDAHLLLKLGFQGSDARFPFGDAGIVVAASLTEGSIHTFKVAALVRWTQMPCCSLRNRRNAAPRPSRTCSRPVAFLWFSNGFVFGQ